jgi:DNA-binding response OmpR family regulator
MQEKRRKMLVVDDDLVFRELMDQFFTLRGWEVVTADGAEEGIRAFRRHHPAVVFLDVHLGIGRDGISLCDQIRDDISSEHTAVLLLSAERRTHGDQLKGGSVGADDYVLKPVQMTVLEQRLNDVLQSRSRR